jgi:hypothetical protein
MSLFHSEKRPPPAPVLFYYRNDFAGAGPDTTLRCTAQYDPRMYCNTTLERTVVRPLDCTTVRPLNVLRYVPRHDDDSIYYIVSLRLLDTSYCRCCRSVLYRKQ